MSLFKPNYEWMVPKTPLGQKRKNKKDGKPKGLGDRQHYSVNERRLVAIEEEGMIAHSNGVLRSDNPKISEQSRKAWFHGWDSANQKDEV